jgi:hypothetical protein
MGLVLNLNTCLNKDLTGKKHEIDTIWPPWSSDAECSSDLSTLAFICDFEEAEIIFRISGLKVRRGPGNINLSLTLRYFPPPTLYATPYQVSWSVVKLRLVRRHL